MKQGIHPVSKSTLFTCGSCGTEIAVASTRQSQTTLDVCSNCHPAFTGTALKSVSGSRVDAYNNRFKVR